MKTSIRNALIALALVMATGLSALAYDKVVRGNEILDGVLTLWGASPLKFEGATTNAYATTFAITDPTAARTITIPNSSGTVALNPYGESIEFEGATADDYETTLAVTDPTADRTITLPNVSGTVITTGNLTSITDLGTLATDISFATGLTGGADISCAAAAAATAGQSLDITGQAGGTAAAGGVGKNGGIVTMTGGAGSAKNGAGATDGDGADVILLGGAKGGSTGGSEVDGIVRVGSPTVNGTKATNMLAVAGPLEVDGAIVLGTQTVTTSLQNPGRYVITICGDQTTVNNNTVYYGPNLTLVATTSSGLTCDITAAGNTTEATVDEAVFPAAAHVVGMVCRNAADANADVTYTLRTAAGATTPSVTCTIVDNDRMCAADIQTTTALGAGATMAVAVSSSGDLGADGFVCQITLAF